MAQPIPTIRVKGGHHEAGRQLGMACRTQLAASVERARRGAPDGLGWDDMRQAAHPYLAATRQALPWLAAEIEGAAEGAGLDLHDLFVLAVEEIWSHPPAQRCSDFAAGPPATADGGIWLAHNNDLSASAGDRLVAVEWEISGQPKLFTLGVSSLFISVGYNEAGLSLTGNELSPNDDRIGLPRLLIVRDILAQRTAKDAIRAALNPERASSYNNLIAHRDGTIVNVEGSATDHALLYARDGWTVHTNHYVAPSMLRYEEDPADTHGSALRYRRAQELMETRDGPVTPGMLRGFLADRANAPDCLCKIDGPTRTVFWCVIGLSEGQIAYGRNPQAPEDQRFAFGVETGSW
jgi:isopenicillin-N N-acyltransferase-like protein